MLHKFDFIDPLFFGYIQTQYKLFKKLRNEIKNNEVDIIHTAGVHDSMLFFLGPYAKIPIVTTIHGDYTREIYNWFEGPRFNYYLKLYNWIEKTNLKRINSLVFVSDYLKNIVSKRISDLKKGKKLNISMETIYNGVNPSLFKPSKMNKENDKINVLSVGWLKEVKGHEYLIKVAKELPDIEFNIVGDGPLENTFKKVSPDNVNILGYKRGEDLVKCYQKCDIYCQPSLYEGLPLSVLEAMSVGRPIVASDVGGISEVVENGENGLLVGSKNEYDLKNAIVELAESEDIRESMGKKNRGKVEDNLTWETVAKDYIKLYENLI